MNAQKAKHNKMWERRNPLISESDDELAVNLNPNSSVPMRIRRTDSGSLQYMDIDRNVISVVVDRAKPSEKKPKMEDQGQDSVLEEQLQQVNISEPPRKKIENGVICFEHNRCLGILDVLF